MSQSIHDSLDAIDPGETTGFNGARLAATVLLLRDTAEGLRVWIQERVHTMRNYPGHVVFPGGGVDPRDFPPRSWDSGELWAGSSVVSMARRMGVTKYKAHALVFAAARELFEEAGTLLAIREDGLVSDASRYHRERELLETHEISFTEFLEHNGMRVDADMLLPWSRWAGEDNNHWFDTFFFIGVLPEGQEPDGDTGEADDAGWFDPQLVLDGWRAGLVRLAIPTWAQLKRLTSYATVKEVLDDASFSDLRPIIGDPRDDERYREYFTTFPVDRI
ncbi:MULTISPECIES: NUDIX hydrolase [Corynebacterium]|uniref:NUDIX domain-containing protein n=1 Tax=Corynebacterium aurimucosum TaxID=169292 RepID=A0A558GL70_9CORY|nr:MULTISPECIES: NUDIX domain-containing protein [Corynebacterium]MBU5654161.1 NUDIX domain-containing protein [Corynebacterium aurimucosum]MDK6814564.1 NUDIX domain-containing protein [Corynebacterium sp. UMB6689]OFL20620.1 NUDIX hydrolase [Corynebacterium sp. HMSC062A03]OFN75802.1 NUDIX hydrolase [Corynebacterium sp. HMSC074E01]OFP21186.1 NUDIX hydrolase [Corynebacterium sp. HMSC066C02]